MDAWSVKCCVKCGGASPGPSLYTGPFTVMLAIASPHSLRFNCTTLFTTWVLRERSTTGVDAYALGCDHSSFIKQYDSATRMS
jgi:hypothetical protein